MTHFTLWIKAYSIMLQAASLQMLAYKPFVICSELLKKHEYRYCCC